MSANKRDFTTAIWDFFCSLKLTISLLILLAVTSIIGTVIQQNRSPEQYLEVYSVTTYRVLESLQFFDMYHSWWFLTLLGLFSINLIACSVKRFPRVWKTVREPVLVADDTLYRTFSNLEEHLVNQPLPQVRDRLAAFLGKEFASPVVTVEGEKVHLFAQKGAWARFGVYVTHLSILIIFLGAIMGSLLGYKGYVNILEGSSIDKVVPRGGSEPIPLGFTVRCDSFSVSFYEGTGRPKEYKSMLTVLENGVAVIKDRPVVVNDPLTYKGITFYQSSYQPAGDAVFQFTVKDRQSGQDQNVSARFGQPVKLAGGGSFRVFNAKEDPAFGITAQLELTTAAGERRFAQVAQRAPDLDALRGGEQIFTLVEFKQRYFTGLQVAKDPGVWVVWVGCTMMIIGSLIAFFLSHRRIWITLQPVGGKTGIKMGGTAHRNQPGFELFFDEFKKKFKAEIS
ncbi:MAG: cytochrome c biogenesis protein ResB [Desulfuromonadales bacterium]|nr:cytochrome c biogenesis protein ResB [Desulfuromonadales bacterium]